MMGSDVLTFCISKRLGGGREKSGKRFVVCGKVAVLGHKKRDAKERRRPADADQRIEQASHYFAV